MNHYAGDMYFNKGGRHYWFAKYLHRKGYKPVVFCCNAQHNKQGYYVDTDKLWVEQKAEEIDTPWVFIQARTYDNNGKDRVLNMIDFYRNLKKTAKEYAGLHGKPDVILASSVHPLTLVAGLKLARHFRVKCICEVRDLWPESIVAYSARWTRTHPLMRILYCGEKWIYCKADAVVMTWPGGYDYIRDQGWTAQIPEDKVVYISNGVDLEEFEKKCISSGSCENLKSTNREIVLFTYTGSIRQVNNLQMLVDAAAILQESGYRNALIWIYGDGDQREILTQQVREMGLNNIEFRGSVPKNEIPQILHQSEVLILHNSSTILDKYGQSQNKFFEYLASEKPILMTYSVGHSVVKTERCGIELSNQSPLEIASAIEKMAEQKDFELEEFKRNCARAKKKYDFKILTEKLIGVIEQV